MEFMQKGRGNAKFEWRIGHKWISRSVGLLERELRPYSDSQKAGEACGLQCYWEGVIGKGSFKGSSETNLLSVFPYFITFVLSFNNHRNASSPCGQA